MSSIRVDGNTTSPIPAISAHTHAVSAILRETFRSYPAPKLRPTPVPRTVTGAPPPGGVKVNDPCATPTPPFTNMPQRQGYHTTTSPRFHSGTIPALSPPPTPHRSSPKPPTPTSPQP